jgi:hypothetical protein
VNVGITAIAPERTANRAQRSREWTQRAEKLS